MIRINLLAPEFVKKEERTEFLVLGYLLIAALVIAGGANFFMGMQKSKALEARIARSQAELGRFETIVKQVDELQAKKHILETKKGIISSLMATRLVYPVYMEKLLAMIPSSLWLKTMNTQLLPDGNIAVSVTAEALDNYAIADFVSALSQNGEIAAVELGTIAAGQGGTSSFSISFQFIPKRS